MNKNEIKASKICLHSVHDLDDSFIIWLSGLDVPLLHHCRMKRVWENNFTIFFMNPFRNLCRFSGLAVNEQDLSPSRGPNQHFLRDFERHLGPTQCGRPGGYDPQVWTLKLIFFQFAF